VLLKLILCAYSNGINSSRRIQDFARYNVLAMALAECQTPDFTIIADFIAGMAGEIETVFTNILLVAEEMKLLSNTVFALDGCKLPSNAGKEKRGTFDDLKDKQNKFRNKIERIVENHQAQDVGTHKPLPEAKRKAMKKLEKHIQQIDYFLVANEPRIGKRKKESQSNLSDNESSKMKTSHGVIQGYNGQAMVAEKHQIVVSAKAFGKGQDHTLLEPMLEETATNFAAIGNPAPWLEGKTIIADTGYFSEENLAAADEKKVDAYIPDQNFRKRDIRFESKRRHVPGSDEKVFREDFTYDKENDVVICPAGQKLPPSRGAMLKLKQYTYKTYHTTKAVCGACRIRSKCLKSEKSRWRHSMDAVLHCPYSIENH